MLQVSKKFRPIVYLGIIEGGLNLNVKVSVVIATYNRYKDLKDCLNSIFSLEKKPYEVIVVDSNSKDGTEKVKDLFQIKFASIPERNRQRARNLGISMANGDVIAFLDDDVVVCKKWLDQIVKPYIDDNVGGVGGRVIPYRKPENFYVKIWRNYVGRVLPNGLVLGNFDVPMKSPVEVDSFIGCNMSFRRELLLKVGGFDENYLGTGYRDDTDLCLRIKKLGYKLIYNSQALVWHKFKGKKVDNRWLYWYVRNHVYFYLKNLFVENMLTLPFFLYYMFMPPRDYIRKSGIKVKINSTSILYITKGLVDGYKAWRSFIRSDGFN